MEKKKNAQTGCDLFNTRFTNLNFQKSAAVGFKVTVVNLAHRVHILVPDLLGYSSLVGQKELIEESTMGQTMGLMRIKAFLSLNVYFTLKKRLFGFCNLILMMAFSFGHAHLYFSRVFCGI